MTKKTLELILGRQTLALSVNIIGAKPQVSLTVPNCNHFAQVSLTVLDIFLDASTKAKKTNL